jgi:crotonobetainyl-CoA:carnitine CoA-transferase CaiB-like acyl-CoA transferase
VVAEERRMEEMMMGEFGHDCAYAVDVVSPIFDEHPRVAPLMGFSRSTTQALPGCTIGQHTQAVLRELGYADDEIAEMYAKSIVV